MTETDHALWFTAIDNNKLRGVNGRITTTGTINEFPLPTPNFYLFGITAGPDRHPSGLCKNRQQQQALQDRAYHHRRQDQRAPPTCLNLTRLYSLTTGSDGNIGLSVILGLQLFQGVIGRITPTGTISQFPCSPLAIIPTASRLGRTATSGLAKRLTMAPITTGSGASRPWGRSASSRCPIPTLPRKHTFGPDGNLWFTEITSNTIGRLV